MSAAPTLRRASAAGFRSRPSTAWDVVTFRVRDRATGATITLRRTSPTSWAAVVTRHGEHVLVESDVATLLEAVEHVRAVIALADVGRAERLRVTLAAAVAA